MLDKIENPDHFKRIHILFKEIINFPNVVQLCWQYPVWKFGLSGFLKTKYITNHKWILKIILSNFNELILNYSENPIEDRVLGIWNSISSNYWKIPHVITEDIDSFYDWLIYGNWLIYQTIYGNPLVWNFNFYKDKEVIIEDMIESDIMFFLYSFHDNNTWYLFINPQFSLLL